VPELNGHVRQRSEGAEEILQQRQVRAQRRRQLEEHGTEPLPKLGDAFVQPADLVVDIAQSLDVRDPAMRLDREPEVRRGLRFPVREHLARGHAVK